MCFSFIFPHFTHLPKFNSENSATLKFEHLTKTLGIQKLKSLKFDKKLFFFYRCQNLFIKIFANKTNIADFFIN